MGKPENNSNSTEKPSKGFSLRKFLSSKKGSDAGGSNRSVVAAGEPQGPPPAYTATAGGSGQPQQPPQAASSLSPYGQRTGSGFDLSSDDISSSSDPYAFLAKFDTVILVDDSASMNAESRWTETKTALNQIVPVCAEHDQDGIEIYFLNSPRQFTNVKDPAAVDQVFSQVRPSGFTPTGERIHDILGPYVADYARKARAKGPRKTGLKPVNLIVITDGSPTDGDPRFFLPAVLQNLAKTLDDVRAPLWQVGVQFFQVGRDPKATRALRQLDDDLGGQVRSGKLRDIVDTVTFDAEDGDVSVLTCEAILKTVLGAVVKRFDSQVVYDGRT